tara:strand:- start:250 stop:870 length:621 start_codon:yes stop_codon:yes gene_type:complete
MITFQVQGSGKTPYKITAEGEGANFIMYCTCPAGRNGKAFCKHRRGLLYGDVTKVAEGVELVEQLRRMAQDSVHMAEADNRPLERQKHIPPKDVLCIRSLADHGAERFIDAGYDVDFEEGDDPWKRQAVNFYGYFKNGKRKKEPVFSISWEHSAGDLVVQMDGSLAYENITPRTRPYGVQGKRGATITTRAKFEDAYDALIVAVFG